MTTHGRTDGHWKVEQYSAEAESAITNAKLEKDTYKSIFEENMMFRKWRERWASRNSKMNSLGLD